MRCLLSRSRSVERRWVLSCDEGTSSAATLSLEGTEPAEAEDLGPEMGCSCPTGGEGDWGGSCDSHSDVDAATGSKTGGGRADSCARGSSVAASGDRLLLLLL